MITRCKKGGLQVRQKRRPPFNSTRYYIEEVVRYRSGYEAGERSVDSYLPLMSEMQLAILISVRTIRFLLCFALGFGLYFLVKALLF